MLEDYPADTKRVQSPSSLFPSLYALGNKEAFVGGFNSGSGGPSLGAAVGQKVSSHVGTPVRRLESDEPTPATPSGRPEASVYIIDITVVARSIGTGIFSIAETDSQPVTKAVKWDHWACDEDPGRQLFCARKGGQR